MTIYKVAFDDGVTSYVVDYYSTRKVALKHCAILNTEFAKTNWHPDPFTVDEIKVKEK